MKIKEIALGKISLPLVTPFRTALRTVDRIEDWAVRVTLEDGSAGYGEAPPTAVITGETRESIEAALRGYLAPAVRGMDLMDRDAVFSRLDRAMAHNTSAKAALDIALHDAWGRSLGQPLFRLLGRDHPAGVRTALETDITISVNDPDTMGRDTERAVSQGFRVLKVKVGKGGEEDVERVRRVRAAAGESAILRIDANQGWTPAEAVRTIRAMEDAGLEIELVEQPVSAHDFEGLKQVTAQVDTPILADEAVFSFADAERVIREHAADLINIKLMKTGGLYPAMKICDLAEAHQVHCMMGCMLESAVSVSAGAHLAAARGIITMADLDGPSLCAENPFLGGPIYDGPAIRLTETPGIGLEGLPVEFETI